MSFRPRARREAPAGVETNSSGQRVTSTGVSGLDRVLGGGLQVGSLSILMEDTPTTFHAALIAAIAAQALAHKQPLAYASAQHTADEFLSRLPAVASSSNVPPPSQQAPKAELEIAWRYAASNERNSQTPAVSSVRSNTSFRTDFDFSNVAPPPAADAPISRLGFPDVDLHTLLENIRLHCERASRTGTVARVVISGLCDELWEGGDLCSEGSNVAKEHVLHAFLARLRAIAIRCGAVVLVSALPHVPLRWLTAVADVVMRLDTFEGQGAHVAGLGGEWMGIVVLEKAYKVGRSAVQKGRGSIWVFKRTRRSFAMEPAAAAPQVEAQEENGKADGPHGKSFSEFGACGTGAKSGGLDF